MANSEQAFFKKSGVEKNNLNSEKFDINQLDIEGLSRDSLKQFLIDCSKESSMANKIFSIGVNTDNLMSMSDDDFIEMIKSTELNRLLGNKAELNINEAYEDIVEYLNSGESPVITVKPENFEELFNGIKPVENQETYDQQKLIVGTIGRAPLNGKERIVCRIKNIAPDAMMPRSTGMASRNKSFAFNFNGVVVFKKFIPPEEVEIESAPNGFLPPDVTFPVMLSDLKEIINNKAVSN